MKCLYTICRKGDIVDKGQKVNKATSILQENLQLHQQIKQIPYSIILFPVLISMWPRVGVLILLYFFPPVALDPIPGHGLPRRNLAMTLNG